MEITIINELRQIAGAENVLENELMSRHTTFRIGGPADAFVTPRSTEELRQALLLCRRAEVPFFVLGNGSNLLVSDDGFRGVILQVYKNLSRIRTEGETIRAQAGALLSGIAAAARNEGLTGFEFAGGIPGTLGGAVVMNAGAYGGEMKDVLVEAEVLTPEGAAAVIPASELALGYRTSSIREAGHVVTGAVLSLARGDRERITGTMRDLASRRSEKQPLEYPSAGSTFKRPEGFFAGKLIMDAGFRGYQVGGARVSDKHCGFVINTGGASAEDVRTLMRDVQTGVEKEFHVRLEPEVRLLGFPKE